jgi:hypothetical protein
MHLLGSRTRTRTLGAGTFRCPRETASRRYAYKAVRRWFSLAAVPVVRLDEIGRFVECQSCNSTFDIGVLAQLSDAAVEDVLTRALRVLTRALRRTATTLLSASAELSNEDRREAVIVLQRYANVAYNSTDLGRDLQDVDQVHLDAELRALSSSLNDQGREAIIDAGLQLASPQGAVDPARLAALQRVSELLMIPGDSLAAAERERDHNVALAG